MIKNGFLLLFVIIVSANNVCSERSKNDDTETNGKLGKLREWNDNSLDYGYLKGNRYDKNVD